MKIITTSIPEVILLEPRVHGDSRGIFLESYNKRVFSNAGIAAEFVQDNHSRSMRNVLRGIHYQLRHPQGKLVRVVAGEVFDVAVDLRRSASTFGKWVGSWLSADNNRMAWIPPGFGHGFLVVSDMADVLYKTTDYYAPDDERVILWSDPNIAIEWPLRGEPVVSPKDAAARSLREAEVFS